MPVANSIDDSEGSVSGQDQTPEQVTAEDRKADVSAILLIFTALVLGALHYVSGWTFDF